MVSLDALVVVAFGPDDFQADDLNVTDELHRWLEAHEFDSMVSVPAAADRLRYTADGLGLLATGMGKAAAASTVAGVLASPTVDVSDALVVTVGVAGASPEAADIGSVVIADSIVDWDVKQRSGDGISAFEYRPHDYVWTLDDSVVDEAATVARRVELAADGSDGEPEVLVGPTICGDEFWHGDEFAGQADWLCRQYGVEGYVTTEMEDAGTATALERAGMLDQYVSVRGVTNYDRPVGGMDGLTERGFELGLENAFRTGQAVVSAFR